MTTTHSVVTYVEPELVTQNPYSFKCNRHNAFYHLALPIFSCVVNFCGPNYTFNLVSSSPLNQPVKLF